MSNRLMNHALLSYAFRPMFLGLAALAVLAMAIWSSALGGVLPTGVTYSSLWHAHEMLFGFALAAVAGFLLTAVSQWTGRPPVQGAALLCLVVAWLVGRIALALGIPPSPLTVALAMAFPILLVFLVGREIVLGGSKRNYPVLAIVAFLAFLDGVYHLGAWPVVRGLDRLSLLAALYLFVVLVSVIAGRIVPAFTGNWLRARGSTDLPGHRVLVEKTVTPMTAIAGALAVAEPGHVATAAVAGATAVLHALRLARWRGFATTREPLLFVLHVAYAWLPVAFALLAVSQVSNAVAQSSVLHAFGVGVIGTMILAVTTRVSLGHTGRALQASRITTVAYGLISVAATVRVAAPMAGGHYLLVIEIAGLAWMSAWLLFLWVYVPILSRPRIAP